LGIHSVRYEVGDPFKNLNELLYIYAHRESEREIGKMKRWEESEGRKRFEWKEIILKNSNG
jgi:hypothetical protein